MEHHGIKIRSILSGILIIAAGVVLLLFNNGILPLEYKHIVFSWQSLLVAIGFINLFSRHHWVFGIVLILVGGFFLLQKMNVPNLDFIIQNGWAIGLIIGGILISCKTIWGKHFFRRHCAYNHRLNRRINKFNRRFSSGQVNGKHSEDGYIDYNYVFSGSSKNIDMKEFKGGEINCVFGGMELDLSDSQLAEGNNYLEINSVFGGIVLYIPIDWKVEIRQNHVFGNFVDHRPKPNFEVNENRMLIIQASSVFGGGEVKCKNQ